MTDWQFANPGWFWLMVLVPLPWLLERWRPRIGWPSFEGFGPRKRPGWVWLRPLPAALRGLAIAALAMALARPQTRRRQDADRREGGGDRRGAGP